MSEQEINNNNIVFLEMIKEPSRIETEYPGFDPNVIKKGWKTWTNSRNYIIAERHLCRLHPENNKYRVNLGFDKFKIISSEEYYEPKT